MDIERERERELTFPLVVSVNSSSSTRCLSSASPPSSVAAVAGKRLVASRDKNFQRIK